jgi:uncharacterized membrane protein
MHFIEHFAVAAGLFVIIDAFWLKSSKFIYEQHIGDQLASKPDLKAGAIFYILYMIGVVVFAINPALGQRSFDYVLGHAALLGLIMYATYDLTNKATLKQWPWALVWIDLAWGTFVTTIVSVITYLIFR